MKIDERIRGYVQLMNRFGAGATLTLQEYAEQFANDEDYEMLAQAFAVSRRCKLAKEHSLNKPVKYYDHLVYKGTNPETLAAFRWIYRSDPKLQERFDEVEREIKELETLPPIIPEWDNTPPTP